MCKSAVEIIVKTKKERIIISPTVRFIFLVISFRFIVHPLS
ncbi:hypothetical protein LD85_2699 [Saccharolobus islandicus L.D.8.5]|uniref:Uncharacterized protein n=1 Tax=Saccharolobus islandicus (strain L.D.8.5 / Lassen \|nr:hypothetical protein LD85_2699 [Sulfolobus islandicus L.D.8.5]